ASVERRDGQYIHESQYDAQQRRHTPESLPIPLRPEHAANAQQPSQAFAGFHLLRSEEQLKILDIHHQGGPPFFNASRARFKEEISARLIVEDTVSLDKVDR